MWITIALLVAGFSGGVWWWVARPEAATVRVVAVRERAGGEGGAVLNASGYVTARRRATVSSKVTGKVVDVLVEEGMKVRVGQLLARLDDTSARAQLNLSQAQLAAAQRMVTETDVRLQEARLTLERTRQLVKEGVSGQASLDTAQAEVDSLIARLAVGRQQVTVAEQQLAVRRTELDDTVIRAPFAGVAISKDAQPGEMVSPISAGGGF
ncbi:MAG: efflux RND transporter periplasmic adaptor subunit, partial [Acidimicrobiia bacterium]